MKVTNECIEMIKGFEGCRLTAYKCPAGVWTIGYGHTGGVHSGLKILQETADKLLRDDLEKFENHVNDFNTRFKYHFTQNQFDALVSFAFNIGSISQLTANGTRNKRMIADKMLLYVKAGGKELEGLKRRRETERALFVKDMGTDAQKPDAVKSVDEISREVIAGKWGNYPTRKKKLENAGYDYETIRKRVNELKKSGGG